MRKRAFPWLRILVHILGWLPLALLAYAYFANRLTINPIQEMEQRLGRVAIYWLLGALAVTPLYTLTGYRELPGRRRAAGLYAFLYASLHIIVFTWLDYGFMWRQIFSLILGKAYLWVGVAAMLLLIPLAVTSFDYFKRVMKKGWQRLHWLVYPAVPIAILHYALAQKGNIFLLRGNIVKPFLWFLLSLLLLAMRLPPIRRRISSARRKLTDGARAYRAKTKVISGQ